MATIPEQYESQRVGVQGYRVLNLDLDGVCADYKGAIRDYLQRQGIDVPERALQTAHYNLTREDGWPFETLDDYIETHKAAEREHLYATMKPLPGVAQALQRLANEHVYIRIVTHRLFRVRPASDGRFRHRAMAGQQPHSVHESVLYWAERQYAGHDSY